MTTRKDIVRSDAVAQDVPLNSCGHRGSHAWNPARFELVIQFFKFSAIGILNTGLHYGVFMVLYGLAEINYLIASTAGYCVGMINSYFMNRRWTFASDSDRVLGQLTRFVAVNVLALGTNAGLLYSLVTIINLQPQIAQIGAIIGSMSVNFICNKFWTFGSTKVQPLK